MLPSSHAEIREYVDVRGVSPFGRWFEKLTPVAAAKVATALVRIEAGNFSNVKGVRKGVYECRIDFGPGYRVYFGKDGDQLVILLGGGSKKRQSNDIEAAHASWKQYNERKSKERR
jgi:putative addiction module killer protein